MTFRYDDRVQTLNFAEVTKVQMTRANGFNRLIATPRLLLEPLLGAHGGSLFAAMQDQRLYRWISAQPPSSRELLEQRYDAASRQVCTSEGEIHLNWAVRRVSDGVYVGKFDAGIDRANVATNIGYVLFVPFWNQGYATEAVRGVASHLELLGVVEQRAFVTLGNDASARVLVKAGFARTRVIPGNDTIRGEKFDDVEYVRRVRSPPG